MCLLQEDCFVTRVKGWKSGCCSGLGEKGEAVGMIKGLNLVLYQCNIVLFLYEDFFSASLGKRFLFCQKNQLANQNNIARLLYMLMVSEFVVRILDQVQFVEFRDQTEIYGDHCC